MFLQPYNFCLRSSKTNTKKDGCKGKRVGDHMSPPALQLFSRARITITLAVNIMEEGIGSLNSRGMHEHDGNVKATKKRFNELKNCCARALYISVHFLAVLCKTTMRNDQVLRCLSNAYDDG